MKKIFLGLLLMTSILALVGCNGKKDEEYKSDLQNVADKMLENASKAETILNQYSNVWSFSIESRGAIPVADMAAETGLGQDTIVEHFQINSIGNIPNDFSINIHSLKSYYEASGELGEIEEVSEEIKSKINELNDPPKDFEKAYDELLDMYTLTEEYIEMAINPNGSLKSFNETKNQLTSDILSKHKRIEAVIPGKD